MIYRSRPSKYYSKRTEYGGHTYDSKAEARRARELDLLKRAKEVKSWERQVPYKVEINKNHVFTYKLDFRIRWSDGNTTHEDVKGYKKGCAYQMFRLKKKCVEAQYGIQIEET